MNACRESLISEMFRGCDMLQAATAYLHRQFAVTMPRWEAQANADARVMLINLQNSVLDDAEEESK